jgi:hypothetical protein
MLTRSTESASAHSARCNVHGCAAALRGIGLRERCAYSFRAHALSLEVRSAKSARVCFTLLRGFAPRVLPRRVECVCAATRSPPLEARALAFCETVGLRSTSANHLRPQCRPIAIGLARMPRSSRAETTESPRMTSTGHGRIRWISLRSIRRRARTLVAAVGVRNLNAAFPFSSLD